MLQGILMNAHSENTYQKTIRLHADFWVGEQEHLLMEIRSDMR